MRVKELINLLEHQDPNHEVNVFVSKPDIILHIYDPKDMVTHDMILIQQGDNNAQ